MHLKNEWVLDLVPYHKGPDDCTSDVLGSSGNKCYGLDCNIETIIPAA